MRKLLGDRYKKTVFYWLHKGLLERLIEILRVWLSSTLKSKNKYSTNSKKQRNKKNIILMHKSNRNSSKVT